MTCPLRSTTTRLVAPVATVLSLLFVTAGPASAAKAPAHTTISAHLTASTVLVKTTASVSGAVTPTGRSVTLERLVGKHWTTIAHATPTRTGSFAFSVRAAKTATTWSLKVIRGASKTTKAASTGTLHLHVVTKQFVVAAAAADTVTAPAATDVTGVVVPAAGGTVALQSLQGNQWVQIGTGRLSGGAFAMRATLPVGAQRLRVVKTFTSTIAQGTSSPFSVLVGAAPAAIGAPAITTAALPAARVGAPYATLLTATGGSGFATWAGTGLPAGLTLSAGGLLAGTPTTQGTAAITVTVTDSAGHATSTSLSLTTAAPAGHLVAAGDNSVGQLGNGTNANGLTVVPVAGLSSVTGAATGSSASLAVKSDGTLWAWGSNNAGELGNGTTTASTVPLQVPGLSGVTAVAEGSQTSYALKSDGTVWAWGKNLDGEVGDGTTTTPRLSPVQVSGLASVVQIASANKTAYALKSDGTVWSWGDGSYDELGNGSQADALSPVQVSGLTGIKQIAAGNHNGYALRADGTVAAWGEDFENELGDGTLTRSAVPVSVSNLGQVTQISASHEDGYALTSSGAVVGWGYNADSELGGATASNPSGVVQITTGALQVEGGDFAAYALKADHTVLAWGENGDGELGNGSITTGTTPAPMTGVSGVLSVIGGGNCESVLLLVS